MIIVLAAHFHEVAAFGRQKNLGFSARHVVNRDSIRKVRATEIHILPSFHKRRDIHAINAEIKHVIRRSPRIKTFEYDVDRMGNYVLQSTVALEAPPIEKTAIDSAGLIEDVSKDAVPGQMDLQEAIAAAESAESAESADPEDDMVSEGAPVAPEPEVVDGDGWFDFLDES